jgi:tetratricopeptide (TPR) repeat protein
MEIKIKNLISQFNFHKKNQYILLLILLAVLIFPSFLLPHSSFEKAKLSILINLKDPNAHLTLSEIAAYNSDWSLAQKEIEKARETLDIDGNKSIAGISSRFEEAADKANRETLINEKIEYWQAIVQTQPEYKDAYLQMALLYFQLNQQNRAITYWHKAWLLNPNEADVIAVGKLLEVI